MPRASHFKALYIWQQDLLISILWYCCKHTETRIRAQKIWRTFEFHCTVYQLAYYKHFLGARALFSGLQTVSIVTSFEKFTEYMELFFFFFCANLKASANLEQRRRYSTDVFKLLACLPRPGLTYTYCMLTKSLTGTYLKSCHGQYSGSQATV